MTKVTVVKEFVFDSGHFLIDYNGACANMHGHTYKLQVGVSGEVNLDTGMIVDFKEIKGIIKIYMAAMEHAVLNYQKDLPEMPNHRFITDNFSDFPRKLTAENMVIWFKDRLELIIKEKYKYTIVLSFIRLYETPTNYAEWRKE